MVIRTTRTGGKLEGSVTEPWGPDSYQAGDYYDDYDDQNDYDDHYHDDDDYDYDDYILLYMNKKFSISNLTLIEVAVSMKIYFYLFMIIQE